MMEQDPKTLIDTLYNIVKNGIRHVDYKRVTDLKRIYTALITGEDMDFLMRRFDKHEDSEMFEQRKRITTHITKSVSKNLIKPLYKVPRSNSAKRVIKYNQDKDQKLEKELDSKLNKFWEGSSLDSWFSQRWIDLNSTDPNAWCVLEWKDFDEKKEKASPYPFEVSSEDAIHYYKDNSGELKFLAVKTKSVDVFGDDKRDVYTLYGLNNTVVFTQLSKSEIDARKFKMGMNVGDVIEIITDGVPLMYIKISESSFFRISVFTHNLGVVPAFRVGFKRDMATNGRTMLSVIDDAEPILQKLVKVNSEMDLTAALHVFPQKIQYANRCDGEGCNLGRLPDGKTCPKCSGSGYQIAKTAQDIIYLTMPKDKDDFLNLDNIIKYVSPSVELIQWQDRYISNLTIRCKEAMYNSELFSKKEVAETATGKNIDLQNVYDSLYDMAIAFSQKWQYTVEIIANIIDQKNGLFAAYTFSKDFKLKSLTDLYNDLKIVSDSGADTFVKEGIQDDIAGIIYGEDETMRAKYDTKKAFYPFSGKSEKEILFAISENSIPERVKVLYLNYGWIFDELYLESLNTKGEVSFYQKTREEQKKLLDEKIDEIIKSMPKKEQPSPDDMI